MKGPVNLVSHRALAEAVTKKMLAQCYHKLQVFLPLELIELVTKKRNVALIGLDAPRMISMVMLECQAALTGQSMLCLKSKSR